MVPSRGFPRDFLSTGLRVFASVVPAAIGLQRPGALWQYMLRCSLQPDLRYGAKHSEVKQYPPAQFVPWFTPMFSSTQAELPAQRAVV